MNDTLHGWLLTLLGLPAPAWAGILACLAGATIPWVVEANVPMDEWAAWKFRLATYGAATFAGAVAGITVWHSWSAMAMWVPALGINFARDIASHFLPWLSPRQAVVLRKNAAGDVVGVKVGDDPTIVITKPPEVKP